MRTSDGRLPDASTDRALRSRMPAMYPITGECTCHEQSCAPVSPSPPRPSPPEPPSPCRPRARPRYRSPSGVTNLHLNAATAGVLTDAGLAVAPVGPAKASGLRVSFPVTGGAIDPATAVGRVAHSGGLAFSARTGTHGAAHQLRRPHHGRAGADRRRRQRAHPARLDRPLEGARSSAAAPGGIGTWVVRAEANLTPAAAAALNAAFGTHLPGGVNIGRVDVRTQPSQVVLKGGGTTLGPRPRHRRGAHVARRRPLGHRARHRRRRRACASRSRPGACRPRPSPGRSTTPGGIALTAGATKVELKNFRINITGSPNLTAQVGDSSTRVPLTVDLSAARTGISNRTAVVRGAKVALSAESAAALNTAFGVSALKAGLPLGTADVRGERAVAGRGQAGVPGRAPSACSRASASTCTWAQTAAASWTRISRRISEDAAQRHRTPGAVPFAHPSGRPGSVTRPSTILTTRSA